MYVMAVDAVAACQCFSPSANEITSPGRMSYRAAPRLGASGARRHDEGLTERMRVPRRVVWLAALDDFRNWLIREAA
jgi:hypothetical protein